MNKRLRGCPAVPASPSARRVSRTSVGAAPITLSLAVKLASIVVHLDEAFGPGGHHFDKVAIMQLVEDAEVREWIETFSGSGLLPVKRKDPFAGVDPRGGKRYGEGV